MTDNIRRYPIGIQTFEKLRKENFFYIQYFVNISLSSLKMSKLYNII